MLNSIAQWCYTVGIPFRAINLLEFGLMCKAIGKFGTGFKGPTKYELRASLLKSVYGNIDEDLRKQKTSEISTDHINR